MDSDRLAGKHALITGAAKGMGAAVATRFPEQGAKVCLGDVDHEGARAVAARMKASGGEAIAVKLDVTLRDEMRAAVARTVEAFGSLNVMLNNAGITKPIPFLDITEADWRRLMDVNALGTLIGMQEASRQMIAQHPPAGDPCKIINVGSILSRQVYDEALAYGASKHAVLALINGGAKALARHNITVNGYGPGTVITPMWRQFEADLVAAGKSEKEGALADHLAQNAILLGRMSTPDDVVGVASFLASSESNYMTGQLLMIDGGMVMQ